jgi:Leucine Rich repeat
MSIAGLALAGSHVFRAIAAPDQKTQAISDKPHKRLLDFHCDKSVGKLTAGGFDRRWVFFPKRALGEALGRYQVPEGTPTCLEVNFNGAANLSFLEKLDPNALDALTFTNSERGFEISDRDLSRVGHLTGLKSLAIERSEAGPKTLEAIGHLTQLRNLDIDNITIKDKDTASLTNLTKLEFLSMNHNDLSDLSLAHVQNLTSLRRLHAKRCGLSGAGMKYLAKLTNLLEINFSSNKKIGDTGIKAMPLLPKLERLDFGDCNVTPASLSSLTKFPSLDNLVINFCTPTRQAFEAVSHIKKLSKLEISGIACQPGDLEPLKKVETLQELYLSAETKEQDKARKMLPNVQIKFMHDRSGVPPDLFDPTN